MTSRGSSLPLSPKKISDFGKPRTRIDDESSIEKEYNYKIGDVLGKGSFGVVKEVTDKTGKSYAMKTIHKDKPGSMSIQLLDREIMVLNRIDHPHLIKLIEVFENDRKVFIILEMCNGGELSDELKRKGKLSEDETRVVMRQLADAVVHLHIKDIVHRDLKLENILLSTEIKTAEPYNIKVTDFGLAHMKAVDGDSDNSMHSRCGTLYYMAPEVLRNKHEYSQLCDVWSMGVIMYALLCGRMPFTGESTSALEESIMSGHLKFKEPEWISISDRAKSLVEGMLTPDTVKRFTARKVSRDPWITGRTDEEEFDPFKMLMDDSPTSSPPTRPHSEDVSEKNIQTTKQTKTRSSSMAVGLSSTMPVSKTQQRSGSLSRTTAHSTSKLTSTGMSKGNTSGAGIKKGAKAVSSGQLLRPSTGINGTARTILHETAAEKRKLSSAKR